MSLHEFRPALREDGTFDPDSLERAGLRWVRSWLKARLSGSDPFFPVDKRWDEDPEALIVDILRDAGLEHNGTSLVARAVLDLLEEASASGEVPAYFKPAVRICQRVRLPLTSSWFLKELQSLAKDPEAVEARWGEKLVREILYAAIHQVPGLPQSPSFQDWKALLRVPRYSTLAWLGLGQIFALRLGYLKDWWMVCPASMRQREIDQTIYVGLKNQGEEVIQTLLVAAAVDWPSDLKASVDLALQRHGAAPLFSREGKRQVQPSVDSLMDRLGPVRRAREEMSSLRARLEQLESSLAEFERKDEAARLENPAVKKVVV